MSTHPSNPEPSTTSNGGDHHHDHCLHEHHGHGGAHGHGHGHAHGHAHHHHGDPSDKRFALAIVLNAAFVVIEGAAGVLADSAALLSDAAHNLSDVMGLAMAGLAVWLARRTATTRRTYGLGKGTVLAALANAVLLMVASAWLLWEAVQRIQAPAQTVPWVVMTVAGIGLLVNGGTAMMFMRGRERDVNVRGAYLHMLADAAVSAGVLLAGLLIWVTGAAWIDPLVAILIVAVIVWGTLGLLRESLDLALDACPAHLDTQRILRFIEQQPGVSSVHDLHVWALAATRTALTAHVVTPQAANDAFLQQLGQVLRQQFDIHHVTLQLETRQHDACHRCDAPGTR